MSNHLNHLAIIMDGNGRWSTKKNISKAIGYKHGAENVKKIVNHCIKRQIQYLTLYAFSSDNWHRPKNEVSELMSLLKLYLKNETRILHDNGVRLRAIGKISEFANDIQKDIHAAEEATKDNSRFHLNIALSYSGKLEIIDACNQAIRLGKQELTIEDITNNLYAPDVPPVDLLIRTSGEQRISDFMLWRSSYAELYFTETFWPDFDESCLDKAIENFQSRSRNFGRSRNIAANL